MWREAVGMMVPGVLTKADRILVEVTAGCCAASNVPLAPKAKALVLQLVLGKNSSHDRVRSY